jgi:F0F1-type ATP synthase assembly protein I
MLPAGEVAMSDDPRLKIPDVLNQPVAPRVMGNRKNPDDSMWGMAKAWGIALDFIFTIFAAAALGYGFDYWKKTAPTGVMIGLAIGFVVAFIRIVRSTMKEDRAEDDRRKAAREPGKIIP